jgi:cellulose synthase/poly-beta-1,6-N-acetylglucosamine synthase-like glycosyltransferase
LGWWECAPARCSRFFCIAQSGAKKAPERADQEGGPAVSILIPAYNEQENIAATIESLVRAEYRNREIIVIDDGSKDNTPGEVQSVIASHPGENIRLISIENGGKANALNVGVEAAHHGIIVVLDADAVLDPQAISYFVPHFEDPQVGAVAGRVRTTDSLNMLDIFQKLEYAIGQNIDKTAFSMINAIGVVPGPAGAWRKSFIIEAGGFHTDTLVEDQEMTLSMLHHGKKVLYESRAIAYTETPHSVKNFLKQRFRWVYGTMQCFWKHKSIMREKPLSSMSLVVMPNIFVYNILLPLTYPFADSALVFGLIFGEWHSLILPFLIFTGIDLLYAVWGVRGEPNKWKLMLAVPLQRVVYRQLLYYTVYKGFVRAIEGTGTSWNKFTKQATPDAFI